jgi:ABC-type uncharacterized transport system substrate-binding protein
VFTLCSSQVIAITVKKQKVKALKQVANKKKPKIYKHFYFTRITNSPNEKTAKNCRHTYISSRREGVAFSQKRDIKKLIISKIKLKKMQS